MLNHALPFAERGKQWRNKIEEELEAIVDGVSDPAVKLKALKLAGEMAHVQAYARRAEAGEAADIVGALETIADISRQVREYARETGTVLDVVPVGAALQHAHSVENSQVLENTCGAIPLRRLFDLPDWAVSGAD